MEAEVENFTFLTAEEPPLFVIFGLKLEFRMLVLESNVPSPCISSKIGAIAFSQLDLLCLRI